MNLITHSSNRPVFRALGLGVLLTGLLQCPSAHAQDSLTFFDDGASIGGEIRGRGEALGNYYTPDGRADRDDEFFLLRTKLHFDLHLHESWGVLVEGQDAREFGSDLINRDAVPNGFEDDLDLFQAYVDLIDIGGSPLSLRAGRQLLRYGRERLVGALLWSNTSRSFDALKLSIDAEYLYGGTIDLFAAEPVIHDYGNFNEFLLNDNQLYGLYATWRDVPFLDVLESYYLLRHHDGNDDEVHTLGARMTKTYDSGWDWEIELAGQVGDFRGDDHAAFATHASLGYTFEAPWTPRVGLGHSYATGDDDPNDGDHETFDNLFPTNHGLYGQMDLFSWRNGHDIELQGVANPTEALTLICETHVFILDEAETDAWYNAGGAVLRRGAATADSYVGNELDLRATYHFNKWFSLAGGYSHFFAGSFVSDTGEDDDADWGYIQGTLTF